MPRAVFLDRDGVINAMVYHAEFGLVDSPSRPDEFVLLPGVGPAIGRIAEMGLLTIVISNQPGVAKGKSTLELFEATQEKMRRELAQQDAYLDAEYYCLHHPEARVDSYRVQCECRKPKPGLLLQAAAELDIDLKRSFFVGDGITDVMAGNQAGCTTILVNSRKCYLCDELSRRRTAPAFIARDLVHAVEVIKYIEVGDQLASDRNRFDCRISCD